ncbi:chemotaxis protein CheB [Sphingomonas sp. SUN039]|uniref:chemotaxis protein CheB n=1 Tax=Sphingomonas sp. SUN039 TaxID=2937787 RepID=UPI0021645D38|nr:chemotaxis protein CheB [Sphingomonas sp. SUN039]UVO53843.1 response regulator [Sphingomonas sp. SUN039]
MASAVATRIDPVAGQHRPISVLIVDDSAVARAALSQMVDCGGSLQLAGAVDGAGRAIAWLRDNRADVVLLDLEMPGWNGLAALPDLLAAGRGAKVLVVSSTARAGAEATLRALAAGAADTLAKPAMGQLNQSFQAVLIDRIERLGRASRHGGEVARFTLRPEPATPVALLGIGASTGGLSALAAFFAGLPASFGAPIVVTQHLPPSFMPYFADQLAAMAGRFAHVATEGRIAEPGEILVAPGHAHLLVRRQGTHFVASLSDAPVPTRCCPSVDPMLVSLGEAAGPDAAAVVLTGMGRDGSAGAARLVDVGGSVMVQDSASSAVWGMPGSIATQGLACVAAPPARLAAHLARRGSK